MTVEEKRKNIYINLKLNEKIIIDSVGKKERIIVENLKKTISITHIKNNTLEKKIK